MPIVAAPAHLLHAPGQVVPLKLVPRYVNMEQPLSDFAVGYIAAQLVAAYGNDALPLSVREVNEIFAEPDTTKLANWCRVINALEEQALVNKIAKLHRTDEFGSRSEIAAGNRRA